MTRGLSTTPLPLARTSPYSDQSNNSPISGPVPKGSARRHVLFLINSLTGGGAERVMCTLLAASAAELRDCRISLVLLDREAPAYQVPSWVEVVQLDCRKSLPRSIWSVWRALSQARPDITVSFLTRANVANIIGAAMLRIPAIVSERVNTSSHLGHGLGAAVARFLIARTYPKARRVIAVSRGVADELKATFKVRADRLVVIANPVDADAIRTRSEEGEGLPIGSPYFVAMGRLVPNKNFGMLIDAFARSAVAANLLILGDGPEHDALSRKIEATGMTGKVTLAGFVANPFPILRRAIAYVSPSNAEGFPNSLLEAMSLNLPVISTNCQSGPSEVLADLPRDRIAPGLCFAPHGILVPTDDPATMAEALRALDDPDRRSQYSERAARRAGEYGVVAAKDAYWSVIRSHLPAD